MPTFGQASLDRLATCDVRLQAVFKEVVRHFDCTILEGHRNQEAQDKAFADGKSQLKWPDGNHNSLPSKAVDAVPYPINWEDRERMVLFAGFVMGVATQMGYRLRWGNDWDMDTQTNDNKFDDLPHYEIVD